MVYIDVKNVCLDYSIYGASMSFRKALFERATGGIIRKKKKSGIVTIRALDDISFRLSDGDRLGVIGPNGAGKTTLLKLLAGVFTPTSGQLEVKGLVSSLLSMAPGIDLEDTGYENIITCGMFLGMTRKEIMRKIPEIEEFTELGEYLELPVRTYSSGMQIRLSFAVATAIDPDILILDEGLGVGDARFAEKAKQRAESLYGRTRITVIASHSDEIIKSMCNKAILVDGGIVHAFGDVDEALEKYREMNTLRDL
ncbi:MAG: ABC transporter ATP-binding protein [Rhodospirillaceae bacterium]|nr:MAG: ABC transporter ATP-binding protein [Rhodospirillaceae bacterium]